MAVTNGTNITAIEKPEVGVDTGPGWATSINNSLDGIDGHDHTTNKGSRITPAALNINADLEMNSNDLTEIRTLSMNSTSDTTTADTRAIYVSGSNNLHYRNGSGQDVQITDGTSVVGAAGTITGMGADAGNQAGASYTDGSKAFNFFTDSGNTDFGKMNHSDLNLYKFSDDNTADTDFVTLQCSSAVSGSGGTITVPGETGQMLTSATSYAGAINIDATGGSGSITLDANTSISIEADTTITLDAESDINLDSNSGILTFKDNGTAIGKISNSSSDLVIENEVDAKDIIFKQYDGNEVVRMADDRRLYFFDKGGEYIYGDGTDLNINSGAAINLNAGTLDLSAQTVDVTLNGAVDALNFDSNTLSIDASNSRIGIGTAAPAVPLDINIGTDNNAVYCRSSDQFCNIAITDNVGSVKLGSDNGALFFETGGTTSFTSIIEAMRIDSSQNVRIGAATATANNFSTAGTANVLGVKSTSGALVSIAATGTNFSGIDLGTDSIRRGGVYSIDGSNLVFYTNATNTGAALTERMRIDSNGDVGINVTNPTFKLHVSNGDPSTATAGTAYIHSGKASEKPLVVINGNTTNTSTDYIADFQNGTAGGQTAIGIQANGQIVFGANGGLTVGSDADGDLYYRASGALARLAKGAASTVLKMNSGATAPEWGTTFSFSGLILFNGTSGTPSALASHNVSSITRTATGKYTITWDTDFSDTNYYILATASDTSSDSCRLVIPRTVAVGSLQIRVVNNDNVHTDAAEHITVAAFTQ